MKQIITLMLVLLFTTSITSFLFAQESRTIIVGTSSSLYDSGLLNHLKPIFEKQYGYKLDIRPIGTGLALTALTKGEIDAAITSNKSAEEYVINSGHSRERKEFVYTYYVLLAPASDPASASICYTLPEAFKRIKNSGQQFVSRGDLSGTNAKELMIWKKCGFTKQELEKENFYIQTGKGCLQTLISANSIPAYTLSDLANYTVCEKNINLKSLPQLKSDKCVYSIITPDYKKFKKTNYRGAYLLMKFLTSNEAKKAIEAYGVEQHGKQLYYGI